MNVSMIYRFATICINNTSFTLSQTNSIHLRKFTLREVHSEKFLKIIYILFLKLYGIFPDFFFRPIFKSSQPVQQTGITTGNIQTKSIKHIFLGTSFYESVNLLTPKLLKSSTFCF